MIIKFAETENELIHIKELFNEYVSFLGENLDFQGYESELKNLPGKYAPPDGILYLALEGDYPAGCCALKRIGNKSEKKCEMKRLYVRPEFRGTGLGKKLAIMIIEAAEKAGYSEMYLDTLERLTEAVGLYTSLGFTQTEPYYDNPIPDAVYWKLNLK